MNPIRNQLKGDCNNWEQKFTFLLLVSEKSNDQHTVKEAVLLSLLSDERNQLYNSMKFENGD